MKHRPEPPKRSDCGKRRYRDHGDANNTRTYRRRRGAGFLRVFECPICKGWHLTSMTRD